MTITTEEAERLAKEYGGFWGLHDLTAATIRSLAAERDALQARVAELERLAGLADSWITAALECKDWRWDADQHKAATHTRDEIRAALEGKKDE